MDVSFHKKVIEQDQVFASIPSETFEIDTDLLSRIMKECEACKEISLPHKSNSTYVLTPDVRKYINTFSPDYLQLSSSRDSPHRLVPKHDYLHTFQKNLNLEQLLFTPKLVSSPYGADNQTGTPYVMQNLQRSTIEAMMLTTPMLIHTLDNIQMEAETNDSHEPYPDLLHLIDNEYSWSEENKTNNTILESKEAEQSSLTIDQTKPVSSPRNIRRHYRTKLMTEEERLSIEHQSRKKAKTRRKKRLSQTNPSSTRKSQRVKKPVVRFSAS